MLDLNFIRENPELVKQAVINKNENADIDKILELDEKRRSIIVGVEKLKSLRNKVSEQIAIKKKNKEDATEDISQMKKVGQSITGMDEELRSVKEDLEYCLMRIPNVPDKTVPVGKDEESNLTVREWGQVKEPDFNILPHWEIGEKLDILNLSASAKITGSGFYVFKGPGARLQRALIGFMMDTHTADGFIEIAPPFLVNTDSMTGTGQLPKLAEDMYQLKDEDYFLIPTGEVPVTNLHREEILNSNKLPLYYVSYTPCFRREAGAAGKDTRGVLRVHQFDKVEMVKIVRPDNSYDELESLVTQAEKIIQKLNIPYRVRLLATGDLSFAAAKCYDIEIWSAGVGKYLEISSVSNFVDFQARRMNCRFREEGKKPQFVHTLNGSGTALPRLMSAVMENYQTEYGSIVIPDVLRPYMGGMTEISTRE